MKALPAVWAAALGFLVLGPSPASAGTFKRIAIDGAFHDWIGVPLAHEDPADSETSADYRRIWIANDEDYLYLRFTLERPDDPFTANDNIFIDADADPTTGYGVIVGSELLIQGGNGYEERNGGFNEGPVSGLEWQAAPAGAGTEFEARISRHATFVSDGAPVFLSDFMALLLEAEDANFTRQETAPDFEGIYYEFAPPPPPLEEDESLVGWSATWRRFDGAGAVPEGWNAPDFDDSQGAWEEGAALFGQSPTPEAYPAPLATELPAGSRAHYFRTRFPWNSNPSSAVFVVTHVLSDGAVLYLNGSELRRIRVPEGALEPATPATGSATGAAAVSVFSIPPELLTQGDNVIAAEVHPDPETPEELVFGLSLLAATSFPATLVDPALPGDLAVVGGSPAVFRVEALGSAPLSYQWLKDGEPIEGADGPSYIIEATLPEHAGEYAARVSNPANPDGALSRSAVLTVLSQPVAITQDPSPAEVTEGGSVTFTVEATGSAPLSYQWLKDGVPIEDATGSSYFIETARASDAGEYSVVVSNPAPSSAESLRARLTVRPDTLAPSLVSIAGSPSRVVLVFSEPVDPASAGNVAHYVGAAGLTVTGAAVSPEDAARVVLTTSAQTLGEVYRLQVANIEDRFGNAMAPANRSFLSTIQIDGNFDDWASVEQAVDDPADAENATDYAGVWITSDSDHVYLRVQTHAPTTLDIFYNNLFIDADGDVSTGFPFRGIGSEMLIQGGSGYQQKGGGFNEGGIVGLDWAIAPEGEGTEFELRFSRRATYATDGEPVFVGDSVMLFVESENTSFQTVDVAPDFEPILHFLLNTPPAELGPLAIQAGADGEALISWNGAGRLQSAESVDGEWEDVPGAVSPHPITIEGGARFYRLID